MLLKTSTITLLWLFVKHDPHPHKKNTIVPGFVFFTFAKSRYYCYKSLIICHKTTHKIHRILKYKIGYSIAEERHFGEQSNWTFRGCGCGATSWWGWGWVMGVWAGKFLNMFWQFLDDPFMHKIYRPETQCYLLRDGPFLEISQIFSKGTTLLFIQFSSSVDDS